MDLGLRARDNQGGPGKVKMTSFPRMARGKGAPRGRRVGLMLECLSNTTVEYP